MDMSVHCAHYILGVFASIATHCAIDVQKLRIQILLGPDIDPTNYGWARDNTMKSLKPKYFDVAPSEVLNFIKCNCSSEKPCSSTRCTCAGKLPCHSRRGRPDKRRDGNKPKPVVGDRGKAILESIDDNSLVIQSFRQYGAELDAKHDKHERYREAQQRYYN
uniref:(California timema) hypothetical protein n=1 Tax=Timema californicum TaxID=61474 RepID=A0A7R9J7V5_TIMCA|nr:unnamed protein product [Timema californicum]